MSGTSERSKAAVAIIGMAGRFPGARDLSAFWQNLRDGFESITTVPDDVLRAAGVAPELISNPNYVKKATVLEGAAMFDAQFFGINAREAEVIDPQHRVFLECAWEALEDAGYDANRYRGLIGVFAGAGINTYLLNNLLGNRTVLDVAGAYQTMLGNDKDYLATRVSYKLNLRGPSYTVQTACSTSLVAVQIACQSLLNYDTDIALAGGVAITFPEQAGYLHAEGMIFSPDGHCRPFDAEGAGIRPGAGAGVVVMKRLHDAIADGDHIRAVIRGAAINNDGAGKMGYTAPSVEGEAEAIALAQARAEVDPDTISYIEAHGTATPLGDPIEIAALTQVFRASTDRKQFCRIGSVKSNIGHPDAAAGVAGLIKTVLALEHRQIPPSLHFRHPNPQIDFANSPFQVNAELTDWESNGHPRRAGVSSFGIGGTNAHVVLEEAPPLATSHVLRHQPLLLLSARTQSALEAATDNIVRHLNSHPEIALEDACHTLQIGRKHFEQRRFIVCGDRNDSLSALERRDRARVLDGTHQAERPSIAFLFSGQGSQYPGMAAQIYSCEPAFRRHFDECAERLAPHLGLDIRQLLFGAAVSGSDGKLLDSELLNQTRFTQPVLFALEYALAKTWMSWGVEPDVMIGHSIGEYVAAAISDVFSLEDALMLVAKRGQLMQDLPAGKMAAVALSERELRSLLDADIALAAINAPNLCTVSGPCDAMESFQKRLSSRGIECHALRTSHAFHSAMMDPILDEFLEVVKRIRLSPPQRPYVSNLTGRMMTAADAVDPQYWARHLRGTVRFADGLQEIMKKSRPALLEVGPGHTLATFARQAAGFRGKALSSLPHARDTQPDSEFLLTTLGRLWLEGVEPDWDMFHEGEKLHRVPLPTYPFERQLYCVQPQGPAHRVEQDGLTKNPDLSRWFYVPSWKRAVNVARLAASDFSGARWLVFLDETGVGNRIVAKLRAAGADCTVVHAAAQFQQEDGGFGINPASPEHYHRVVQALQANNPSPLCILHLWNVTRDRTTAGEILDRGFYSVLYLAQAVGSSEVRRPVRISVISNRMQSVTGVETIEPAKATVLGLCKTIPQEYPDIECTSSDIDASGDWASISDALIQALITDAVKSRDSVIAHRGSQRWAETYEPIHVESDRGGLQLRQNGVYLITGGLGGFGTTFARFLAEEVKARLVLVSRTALPPRAEWEHALPTASAAVKESIRAILAMEAAGAEVLPVAADITKTDEVRALVNTARERFGAINGIIHAAGVPGGGIIQARSRDDVERVFRAKLTGTVELYSAVQHTEFDFFVLCSSIDSVSGLAGAADYCAANAFLDAFAVWCHGNGDKRVTAVNWDVWQQVGMAARAVVPQALQQIWNANIKQGILPDEGNEALRRVLALSLPQVVVLTRDLPRFVELRRSIGKLVIENSELGIPAAAHELKSLSHHTRPAVSSLYAEPSSETERRIARIWEEVLGIEGIGTNDDFFELGGHSLMGTQLLSRIHVALGLNLPVRQLFESRTVAALASVIDARLWREKADKSLAVAAGAEREEFEL